MGNRLAFHEVLVDILGSRNVYFQPPASVHITYPCIIYNLDAMPARRANNTLYGYDTAYNVLYITTDPDSIIPVSLLGLAKSRFENQYVSDNLYHNAFTIYY